MLTAADLAQMEDVQEDVMMDTCDVLTYTAGDTNAYGKPEPATYASSGAIACGVGYIRSAFSQEARDQVSTLRVQVRLPLDTTVTGKDRIEVQKRFGVDITTVTYGILGEIRRGPSCLTCDVFQITDGS